MQIKTDYVVIVWQQCRTNWNLDTRMLGMQTYRAVLANSVAVSHGVNMLHSNTTPKYICPKKILAQEEFVTALLVTAKKS